MNGSLNNMRKIVKEEIRQRVNEYAEKRKTLKESMSSVPNEIVIDDGKTLKLVKESKSKDDAEDIITEYLDRNYRNGYDEPEIIGFKNYSMKDDKIVVEDIAWTEDKENEFISKGVADEKVNNTLKKENIMKESKAYYEYPKNSGCHVRETTNTFVAIDKNGNTIGQSKTKAGAEALIDEKCSKKQIKEGVSDWEDDEEIEIEFECPSWWYDVDEIVEERKDEFEEFLKDEYEDPEDLTKWELREAKKDFAREIIAEDREEFSRRAGNDIKVYDGFDSFTISGPKSKIVELIRNEYGDNYTSHDLTYLADYIEEETIKILKVPTYFEPSYNGDDKVLYESLSKGKSLKEDKEDEKIKYFECDFRPNDDAWGEYSICIKAVRKPSKDEAVEFCKNDLLALKNDEWECTGVYETTLEDAKMDYDMTNSENFPVFGESLKEDKKEPIFFGKKAKKDELEEASKKIPYGLKAFQLNEIISHMNDEGAYYESGWLYVWPDGTETVKEAQEDFGTKEEYEELEELFKKVYRRYHRDGLYKVDDKTLAAARKWDKKLGLSEIVDVGRKDSKLAKFDDDYEKRIGEVLAKNGIEEEDFEIKEESDYYDTEHPYKVIYFFEDDVAKRAFDALNDSGEFKTVKDYVEQRPAYGYSPIEILVSEHDYASADKE